MKLDEVTKWTPFVHEGKIYDLSHLDAHKITYTHSVQGKADIVIKNEVDYSKLSIETLRDIKNNRKDA